MAKPATGVKPPESLTIGELAVRSGVATSALRFYESRGLLTAGRTPGNQRRYPRSTLRRVAFLRAAQEVGLPLDEVRASLLTLPTDRTPTKRDWDRLSRAWRARLDSRIASLVALRDDLTGCIGCGCLSLRTCRLLNPGDRVAARGAGARYLLGDDPEATRDPEPNLGPFGRDAAGPQNRRPRPSASAPAPRESAPA